MFILKPMHSGEVGPVVFFGNMMIIIAYYTSKLNFISNQLHVNFLNNSSLLDEMT